MIHAVIYPGRTTLLLVLLPISQVLTWLQGNGIIYSLDSLLTQNTDNLAHQFARRRSSTSSQIFEYKPNKIK